MINRLARKIALYAVAFACIAYGGSPLVRELYAGELGEVKCCKYDNECTGGGVACCPATSPEGCSQDKKQRCLNACQDGLGNDYCPGDPNCS